MSRLSIGIGNRVGKGGMSWSSYSTPLGWDWELPVPIQQKGNLFRADPTFDLEAYANIAVTKTYYLNTVSGSDAADGLTTLTPNKTLTHIINDHGDADQIVLQDGCYITRLDGLWKPNRSTKFIGEGTVWMTNDFVDYIGAWSLTGGQTYTFQCNMVGGEYVSIATDSSILGIYDQETIYPMRASVAEVEANPGSIYWAGGVLYVHTLDGLTPAGRTDIKYRYGAGHTIVKDNLAFYFENINFTGFSCGNASATGGLKVYLKDCNSVTSYAIAGVDEVILQNCTSSFAVGDIVNIGAKNGVECNVIEIDCEFKNVVAGGTDQASTGHQAAHVVRINGLYQNTTGQCCADVDTCMVLMLGSHLDLSVTSKVGYYFGGDKAWLDTVHISNCADYDLVSEAGTTIYHHNCTFEKGVNNIDGTLTEY